jgi:RecB family exonuclease
MDFGLTLLAGYWIFRGLEALIANIDAESTPAPPPSPAPKPLPVEPTTGGTRIREPTGARFADAKSLFGGEYVSFTRLDTFEKCKHKFKLTYLQGYRQEDRDQSKQARSGNSFHEISEDLFGRYRGQSVGRALEDATIAKEPRLRQVLEVVPEDATILAAELELRFRARDREFLGYVDLAVELPDSTVALVDFKTGYRNPMYPPDPLQLNIYSIPELLLRPERSVRLAFVLVDAGRTEMWTNGPENRDDVIRSVRERVVEAERETVFPRYRSGLCQYCHVKDLCDAGEGDSVYRDFARRRR